LLRERAPAGTIEDDGAQVRGTGPPGAPGAAVFTWRGDYRATGWLGAYTQITG
jgi:hypothetical protein